MSGVTINSFFSKLLVLDKASNEVVGDEKNIGP